jgi:hypothetical protein
MRSTFSRNSKFAKRMRQMKRITPKAIRAGARLKGFSFTMGEKQKNQSDTSPLWFSKRRLGDG